MLIDIEEYLLSKSTWYNQGWSRCKAGLPYKNPYGAGTRSCDEFEAGWIDAVMHELCKED